MMTKRITYFPLRGFLKHFLYLNKLSSVLWGTKYMQVYEFCKWEKAGGCRFVQGWPRAGGVGFPTFSSWKLQVPGPCVQQNPETLWDGRIKTAWENPARGDVWGPSGCRPPPTCPLFLLSACDSGILSKTAWAHSSGWDLFGSHVAAVSFYDFGSFCILWYLFFNSCM